jgi:hypothetical protein
LHCGVLEFIADEGNVLLPHWVSRHAIANILRQGFGFWFLVFGVWCLLECES